MSAWLLTIVLAVVVSGTQTWFKIVSREPPQGKKHALTMDDAVFWIDWIVTAVSSFFLFLLATAQANKPIGTPHVLVAVVVLGLGGMVIPPAFRILCYDGSGKIRGWTYVLIANALGLLVLLSTVAAGVKAYGA